MDGRDVDMAKDANDDADTADDDNNNEAAALPTTKRN